MAFNLGFASDAWFDVNQMSGAPASILDDLQHAISSVGIGYSDALYDHQTDLVIRKNKTREITSAKSIEGISFRRYTQRGWIYANSNKTNKPSIRRLALKIKRKNSNRKDETRLKLPDPIRIDKTASVKKDPDSVSPEEKLQRIRDLYNLALSMDSRILDVLVAFSENKITRALVSSTGTQARQVIPRTRLFMTIIVKEGGVTDYDYSFEGGIMGYEVLDKFNEQYVRGIVNSALEQLKAVTPPGGLQKVILDPGIVGTVCHESFGHGLEADQVLRGRSYLKNMIGKRVASDIVTMYEDSSMQGAHGSYFFDDDGTEARKNMLVEKGVLVSFIHDTETAAAMNASLTGNSRTQNAARRRFIRMSNTYAKPGDWTLDDMVKDMKKGVMILRWQSGMEDPLGGGMQVIGKKGYLIENGTKTTPLKSITLSGRVLEVLGNVDAISKEAFMVDSGNCGKGPEDFVPVGSGGTWWRTTAVIG
jgi:TldD protein